MDAPLFSETQRFRQLWIWALMTGILALLLWGIFQQIVLNEAFGDNPGPDWVLILTLALMLALSFLLFLLELEVRIFKNHLEYRFYPLISWHTIRWDEVEKVYLRKYKPILEYGGWGIRYKLSGRSRAYNVSGNTGLQLVLQDGSRVLFGTHQAEKLKEALAKTESPYADVDQPEV